MLLFGLCPDSMEDFDTLMGQESTTGTKGDSNSRGFGMCLDTLAEDLRTHNISLESKESKEAREAKATKEDNTEAPIHLWNERVLPDWNKRTNQEDASQKLEIIRSKFLL
jgi:hypothetical protein